MTDLPPYVVRPAEPADVDGICSVCRAGFTVSSSGLLPPDLVERQAVRYYSPDRVAREIVLGEDDTWQGYVVAASDRGDVLGAAGGGVAGAAGHLFVLYLDPALRGHGIGSALLSFVTEQQLRAGAREQWVTVTEGNELALPFYRARGFVVRGRQPYLDPDTGEVAAYSERMSRPVGR